MGHVTADWTPLGEVFYRYKLTQIKKSNVIKKFTLCHRRMIFDKNTIGLQINPFTMTNMANTGNIRQIWQASGLPLLPVSGCFENLEGQY